MLLSAILVWSDKLRQRTCRIHHYDTGYIVEVETQGEPVLRCTCPSAEAALQQAEQWRRSSSSQHAAA